MYLSYDGSNYKDYVDLYADKGGDKLKAGATYNFTLHDTQGYRYYKAVPLLVDVTDPTIKKELSDFAFEVESSAEEPRIDLFPASYTRSSEYAVAYQTGFSDKPDLTKWPGADPSEQWYEYEFCFPFQLKNGSYIDLWWESITFEGTLEYSAFNNVKKKIPFSRVLPSNMKTGLYVIRVKFLSNVHENNYFAWSVRPKLVVKKKDGNATLTMERTEDILSYLGAHKKPGQFLCGFSMETENVLENSKEKLKKKNADMIVANSLRVNGAGFGTDTNVVTLITKDWEKELPIMKKEEVAVQIFDEILKG